MVCCGGDWRIRLCGSTSISRSPDLNSVPSIYNYSTNSNEPLASDPQESIPTIDFSLLNSTDVDLRSKEIQELDKACKEWGFFQVINHGVPEALMKMVISFRVKLKVIVHPEFNCPNKPLGFSLCDETGFLDLTGCAFLMNIICKCVYF
ncbi:oxoglutarate/iron-dependent dioxygenase [Artemisia annua]|uniref:Oxoglutarate/iron-dependent dioxygenase n=1 Tax=Artemisia annua TaxID=35608 RepID=A0A2U1PUN0_ARTAN|nr:oxoglutarate/iron-dependent dioxygenase [Artemisia annua]